ncbi:MAG: oxygen-dependent coproporphyrinogen oxidase [Deltaproteobacteria bacterium]|nr:MAG: oxygen-dependent coproporphyrinogen oxidase [Deltaproteobacteria bacterium]
MSNLRDVAHRQFLRLQDEICKAMATLDGHPFAEAQWDRPGGGGGRSRVIQDGRVFEKAGVNVSAVHGVLPPEARAAMRARKADLPDTDAFFATGISLVMHPHNPMAPTVHLNYRYFELGDGSEPAAWWVGGGADLTPAYLFEDDARHFHACHKQACDKHDPSFYPRFKRWCDDYFTLRHRGERRGIGGIFFDDLADRPALELFDFQRDCGEAFLSAYLPILERRLDLPFTDAQRQWQQLRRGRYVEFNLVWDRGTVFGLKTDARVESVLMSLPLTARWEVDHQPEPDSPEARLLAVLREPVDWIPLEPRSG